VQEDGRCWRCWRPLSGRQRQWCSKACKERGVRARADGRPFGPPPEHVEPADFLLLAGLDDLPYDPEASVMDEPAPLVLIDYADPLVAALGRGET
jgi:hypothetical protein